MLYKSGCTLKDCGAKCYEKHNSIHDNNKKNLSMQRKMLRVYVNLLFIKKISLSYHMWEV